MTILLAFFIMMNTLAEVRDYGLIGKGLGLFQMSFNSLGLPGFLKTGNKVTDLNAVGGKFRPEEEETPDEDRQKADGRLIDPDKRDLKETLLGLLKTEDRVILPLDVQFGPRLTQRDQDNLMAFARLIRGQQTEIHVCAAVPPAAAKDRDPWQESGEWALRVGVYLSENNRVGGNPVIAAGGTAPPSVNEKEPFLDPMMWVVLRPLRAPLSAPGGTGPAQEKVRLRNETATPLDR